MNNASAGDTPSITSSCYAYSTIQPDSLWCGAISAQSDPFIQRMMEHVPDFAALNRQKQQENQIMANTSRRIVQVFIADPNENVPLEQSVIYKGDQKLTDLTDAELFFEVPITELLKSHNEKRVKFLDKEATKRSGKDVVLDAVKIRDLKMVVVTVAQF